MPNTFEILAGFLARAEPEVAGRSLEEPPEAVKVKLRDFARGALPVSERAALLVQLAENRRWLALLAQEVKQLRERRRPGEEPA